MSRTVLHDLVPRLESIEVCCHRVSLLPGAGVLVHRRS